MRVRFITNGMESQILSTCRSACQESTTDKALVATDTALVANAMRPPRRRCWVMYACTCSDMDPCDTP